MKIEPRSRERESESEQREKVEDRVGEKERKR
jgi:hypothetical protein